jgi:hypothetical protein
VPDILAANGITGGIGEDGEATIVMSGRTGEQDGGTA